MPQLCRKRSVTGQQGAVQRGPAVPRKPHTYAPNSTIRHQSAWPPWNPLSGTILLFLGLLTAGRINSAPSLASCWQPRSVPHATWHPRHRPVVAYSDLQLGRALSRWHTSSVAQRAPQGTSRVPSGWLSADFNRAWRQRDFNPCRHSCKPPECRGKMAVADERHLSRLAPHLHA